MGQFFFFFKKKIYENLKILKISKTKDELQTKPTKSKSKSGIAR